MGNFCSKEDGLNDIEEIPYYLTLRHLKVTDKKYINSVNINNINNILYKVKIFPLIKLSDDKCYFGEMRELKFGETYTPDFVDKVGNKWVMHGIGTYEINDKYKYYGEFVNGYAQGYGKLSDNNESIFEGYFNKDRANGNCIEENKIFKFKGEYYAGKKEGKGEIIFNKTKYRYIGNFAKGLFHGIGEFYYSKDNYFKGRFFNGVPSGPGEYYNKELVIKANFNGENFEIDNK